MAGDTTHTIVHQISNKLDKLTPIVRILDNYIIKKPSY
jgi:hypothetical protein